MNITDNVRQCSDLRRPFHVRCTVEQFGLFLLWCHRYELTNDIPVLCPRLVDAPPDGKPCDLRPGHVV